MEISNKTLYRYAGGKNRVKNDIAKEIHSIVPNLKNIVAPFFGGGSVEILLASQGVKVDAYDVFEPLTDFWHYVLNEEDGQERLGKVLRQNHPLNVKKQDYPLLDSNGKVVHKLQRKVDGTVKTKKDGTPYKKVVLDSEKNKQANEFNREHYKTYLPLLDSSDRFTRAWAFYILMKGSYSGKIGCSTYLSREEIRIVGIEKMEKFYNPNLSVSLGDCFDVIPDNPDTFMYLDPPYADTVSTYYGVDGSLHKGFDHIKLANILKNHKGGFLMSYDNSSQVVDLYKGWTEFRYITIPYQMSGTKRYDKKELMIVKHPS